MGDGDGDDDDEGEGDGDGEGEGDRDGEGDGDRDGDGQAAAGPVAGVGAVAGCTVAETELGSAVRRDVPGIVGPLPATVNQLGFESIATISHEFFRPLSITFDFAAMAVHLTRPRQASGPTRQSGS